MAESLLETLKSKSRLPTPPGTALQILRLCQDEDVSIIQLADTLSSDPALSLRLLRYANSSLFGVRKQVTNVRDAVVLLGLRAVRLMALSFSLISSGDPRACRNFDFGQFWTYSLAAAVAARHLARQRREIHAEEAFAVSLLARIGKLVFAVGMPEEYAKVLDASGGTLGDTSAGELAAFGVAYPQMGAELIREWGIPNKLAKAIEHQLTTDQAGNPELERLAELIVKSAKVADVLCDLVPPDEFASAQERLATEVLGGLSVPADELMKAIREEFDALAGTLKMSQATTPDAARIQAEAGQVLGELSLAAQASKESHKQCGDLDGSWTDPLTGLPTRAAFDRKISQIWSDATRAGRSLGLVFVDVDGFSAFNAANGREAGDLVLRLVAAAISRVVRTTDMAARYRADEFAVVLSHVDRLVLAQSCVRIRKLIEGSTLDVNGHHHRITISVGAALIERSGSPYSLTEVIEAARHELASSRAKGGNTCSMRHLAPAPATC